MDRNEINICILRVGGTNCDYETKRAFNEFNVNADIIHTNDIGKTKHLLDYHALIIPGGFSYGDYVRAGAMWAKRILARMEKPLKIFIDENRPILGICNGFQVLVESGLLPGFDGMRLQPEAALATNFPSGYNCRWVYVKHENCGKSIFTKNISRNCVLHMPIAHSEGRFVFEKSKERRFLKQLEDNDQIVFRYCHENGDYAAGIYPFNPNGSFHDIAAICNIDGTILGIMPHPERGFYRWQSPDWTREPALSIYGHGQLIFKNLVLHLQKTF
jgi:phosphoribosylformylglycinamidine synthase